MMAWYVYEGKRERKYLFTLINKRDTNPQCTACTHNFTKFCNSSFSGIYFK